MGTMIIDYNDSIWICLMIYYANISDGTEFRQCTLIIHLSSSFHNELWSTGPLAYLDTDIPGTYIHLIVPRMFADQVQILRWYPRCFNWPFAVARRMLIGGFNIDIYCRYTYHFHPNLDWWSELTLVSGGLEANRISIDWDVIMSTSQTDACLDDFSSTRATTKATTLCHNMGQALALLDGTDQISRMGALMESWRGALLCGH